MGRIDRDESEQSRCYNDEYARKFKSYRLGLAAGKRDGARTGNEKLERNPYVLTPEILALLRKRARWEAGHSIGFTQTARKRLAKVRKGK